MPPNLPSNSHHKGQILLLDDRINHLDGVVFMYDQPLDRIKDDETLPLHQTLPYSMTRRGRGRRRLPLLIPSKRAYPLLGQMVILDVIFSLRGHLSSHLGSQW